MRACFFYPHFSSFTFIPIDSVMTTTTQLLPLTLAERSLEPDVLRVSASFAEYLDFAEQCEYNVEYINGEIISISQASLPHETLFPGSIIYWCLCSIVRMS